VVAAPELRPVRPDELLACAEIWRVSINDYTHRLGQPAVPTEFAPLVRLYTHLQATDPDRFVVATAPDPDQPGADRIVAFAAAVCRERLWFLSMLFVLPDFQGAGLGRALLTRVSPPTDAPDTVRSTATDSAQPISNALYGSLGMVPRVPLLNLIGLPERLDVFGELPSGIAVTPFEEVAATDDGHRALGAVLDDLDRALLGAAHPVDHRFLRGESRHGWLYRGPDGTPLGYGYAGESGRVGPVAATDEGLLAPILGHLMTVTAPRGAFALWLAGTADRAVVAALQAGFRLDQFPILLCWDRPFADFSRYAPISPGLL
jgi:GNAT superfamily N-acetyltransferase